MLRRGRASFRGAGAGGRLTRAGRSVLAFAAIVVLGASVSGVLPWQASGPSVGGGSAVPGALSTPAPPPSATGRASPSGAAVVHVATGGSDAATGAAGDPWRTLAHAVAAAPDGATIRVGPGTFAGFTIDRSGLSIRGTPGRTVVAGDASRDDVILVTGARDVVLSGLVVTGAPVQFGAGIRIERGSSRVTVEHSILRDNRSFGLKIADSDHVTVRGNDIGRNETGIEISRAGEGVLVTGNDIHDNDRMVTASRGGNGIVFHLTTGAITVTGNRLWGNRAPHADDPGYDGGAFEVYGASNLAISGNLLWDNNNAMETGTDGTAPCSGNRFERNTVQGRGSVPGETTGLILRCAEAMLVAHNTFDGLDHYAFYVSASGSYAGSVAGLRVVNNVVVRGRAWSLAAGLPAGLVLDHNVIFPGDTTAVYGSRVAWVEGHGNTSSIEELRAWTGAEAHGVQADPRFVDRAAGDYRLAAGSPAIDRGLDLGAPYAGAAPDAGVHEADPGG